MSSNNHITDQQRMWQVMKILKRFDITILRYTTTAQRGDTKMIAKSTAQTYCFILVKAGFLKDVGEGNFVITEKAKGAIAPMLTRDKKLLDPNTEELITLYKGDFKFKNINQIMPHIADGKEFRIAEIISKTKLKFEQIIDAMRPLIAKGEIIKQRKEKQGRYWVGVYVYKGNKGIEKTLCHNISKQALTKSKQRSS